MFGLSDVSGRVEIELKIAKYLKKRCPAFRQREDYSGAGMPWHICDCLINDGPCACVWHCTSSCNQGHWDGLEWIDDKRKKNKNRAETLKEKVVSSMKKESNKPEEPKKPEVQIEELFDGESCDSCDKGEKTTFGDNQRFLEI